MSTNTNTVIPLNREETIAAFTILRWLASQPEAFSDACQATGLDQEVGRKIARTACYVDKIRNVADIDAIVRIYKLSTTTVPLMDVLNMIYGPDRDEKEKQTAENVMQTVTLIQDCFSFFLSKSEDGKYSVTGLMDHVVEGFLELGLDIEEMSKHVDV